MSQTSASLDRSYSIGAEPVTNALFGKQMLRASGIGFQLSAQARHEHAKVMRFADALRSPDLFQEISMRQHLALLLD